MTSVARAIEMSEPETQTYPSGRVVNSIYDAAGRLSTAKATKEPRTARKKY